MLAQSLPGLRKGCVIVVRELRTRYVIFKSWIYKYCFLFSAIARSEAQTPVQKFGFEYLKRQQSLHRPLSPHLTIYKPQLTWMLSGAHRISGCVMAGS